MGGETEGERTLPHLASSALGLNSHSDYSEWIIYFTVSFCSESHSEDRRCYHAHA